MWSQQAEQFRGKTPWRIAFGAWGQDGRYQGGSSIDGGHRYLTVCA